MIKLHHLKDPQDLCKIKKKGILLQEVFTMIKRFMEEAKGFTKNPLGIIALFISLIYGFACLVLGFSISNLEGNIERLSLIWFIILFPFVILIAFIYLVIKHHEKLYSPGDFRADESFMQTLNPAQVTDKQLKDVKKLESAPVIENIDELEIKRKAENEGKDTISENEETNELSEDALLEIYKNAQKWVIDDLSLTYKVILKKDVVLNLSGKQYPLDAYGIDNLGGNYAIVVKYWQTAKSDKKLKLIIQDFMSKNKEIYRYYPNCKIIIALVYDNLDLVDKDDIKNFVMSINASFSVLFFNYKELRKNYE
jgi:hypothetical protein